MKASQKKRLIISYQNLPQQARDLFDSTYGDGYANAAQKITKPDGSLMYVVPLETDDAVYMVKVDVVIDSKFSEEDFDKEILGDSKSDEEITSNNEDEDGEDESRQEKFVLVHGDYSDIKDLEDTQEEEEEDI